MSNLEKDPAELLSEVPLEVGAASRVSGLPEGTFVVRPPDKKD